MIWMYRLVGSIPAASTVALFVAALPSDHEPLFGFARLVRWVRQRAAAPRTELPPMPQCVSALQHVLRSLAAPKADSTSLSGSRCPWHATVMVFEPKMYVGGRSSSASPDSDFMVSWLAWTTSRMLVREMEAAHCGVVYDPEMLVVPREAQDANGSSFPAGAGGPGGRSHPPGVSTCGKPVALILRASTWYPRVATAARLLYGRVGVFVERSSGSTVVPIGDELLEPRAPVISAVPPPAELPDASVVKAAGVYGSWTRAEAVAAPKEGSLLALAGEGRGDALATALAEPARMASTRGRDEAASDAHGISSASLFRLGTLRLAHCPLDPSAVAFPAPAPAPELPFRAPEAVRARAVAALSALTPPSLPAGSAPSRASPASCAAGPVGRPVARARPGADSGLCVPPSLPGAAAASGGLDAAADGRASPRRWLQRADEEAARASSSDTAMLDALVARVVAKAEEAVSLIHEANLAASAAISCRSSAVPGRLALPECDEASPLWRATPLYHAAVQSGGSGVSALRSQLDAMLCLQNRCRVLAAEAIKEPLGEISSCDAAREPVYGVRDDAVAGTADTVAISAARLLRRLVAVMGPRHEGVPESVRSAACMRAAADTASCIVGPNGRGRALLSDILHWLDPRGTLTLLGTASARLARAASRLARAMLVPPAACPERHAALLRLPLLCALPVSAAPPVPKKPSHKPSRGKPPKRRGRGAAAAVPAGAARAAAGAAPPWSPHDCVAARLWAVIDRARLVVRAASFRPDAHGPDAVLAAQACSRLSDAEAVFVDEAALSNSWRQAMAHTSLLFGTSGGDDCMGTAPELLAARLFALCSEIRRSADAERSSLVYAQEQRAATSEYFRAPCPSAVTAPPSAELSAHYRAGAAPWMGFGAAGLCTPLRPGLPTPDPGLLRAPTPVRFAGLALARFGVSCVDGEVFAITEAVHSVLCDDSRCSAMPAVSSAAFLAATPDPVITSELLEDDVEPLACRRSCMALELRAHEFDLTANLANLACERLGSALLAEFDRSARVVGFSCLLTDRLGLDPLVADAIAVRANQLLLRAFPDAEEYQRAVVLDAAASSAAGGSPRLAASCACAVMTALEDPLFPWHCLELPSPWDSCSPMLADAIRESCAEYAGSSAGRLPDLARTLASLAAITLPSVLALLRAVLGAEADDSGHRDADIAQDGIFGQLMDVFAGLGTQSDERRVLLPRDAVRSFADKFTNVAGIAIARAACTNLVQSPLSCRPIGLLLPGDVAAFIVLSNTAGRLGSAVKWSLIRLVVFAEWPPQASAPDLRKGTAAATALGDVPRLSGVASSMQNLLGRWYGMSVPPASYLEAPVAAATPAQKSSGAVQSCVAVA